MLVVGRRKRTDVELINQFSFTNIFFFAVRAQSICPRCTTAYRLIV
jgi:hypothetical protein